MTFAVCAALSIELNNFFNDVTLAGFEFPLNISVVFFCFTFFIIDLVTELYDNRIADYFVYSKLFAISLYVLFGNLGVMAAGITTGDIAKSFQIAPTILGYSIIASLVGYQLTGRLMQYLKIKFKGRFLFSRYLLSTLPGEIVFSLVFSFLSFSHDKSVIQTLHIFLALIVIKFFLSFIFSLVVVPITKLLRHYLGIKYEFEVITSLPFEKFKT
jgi:uncharacterized PurR-regulated membrane protein YhhQ (DUF165 family)